VTEPDDDAPPRGELTLAHVAARAGVSPGTVRRWVARGLIPGYDGSWTPSAGAYVRVIARLRARGHSLEAIKHASDAGQLAIGPIENLLESSEPHYTLRQAARTSGLEPELIRRVYSTMGLGTEPHDGLTGEDVQILSYVAAVLEAGIPLPAFLQLMRVYGQMIAQIADAEVRLVHLYVHEPLMRADVPSVEIAEEMEGLTREVLPFAAPFMNYLHARLLAQFVEQDIIGHMEVGVDEDGLQEGRLRVAIAFADLAGYARLTVERGDAAALSTVERFVETVAHTLPVDARVIKTLGDEVMIIGPDPTALTAWAVSLTEELSSAEGAPLPQPRIGVHYGEALYRDGDYYGRDVNQAARVVARASGGEVLVTRPVVDEAAGAEGLSFELIGEVRLKGFSEPTELFVASVGS
jgi:adenylate cyclase